MFDPSQNICSPLLSEKQASQYLKRSLSSLRRDRKLGQGPNFVRIGRSVRYVKCELDEFINQRHVAPRSEEVRYA
jgi:predicted DNA-binding transcriptional regulator AlpA